MSMECHYCDSPTAKVSEPSSKSKNGLLNGSLGWNSTKISSSMGNAETYTYIQSKLKIDCGMCDKCYFLEADLKMNSSHGKYVMAFTKAALEDTPEDRLKNLAPELSAYKINFKDIILGAYAITIPVSLKNDLYRFLSKKVKTIKGFPLNIFFMVNGVKYYLLVHKNIKSGKLIATHVERVHGFLNDIQH
ncbi:hypothetical protein [Methanococcus maripaludis]|uniref:Uncharacterized protein n=1 Tax=Methanococcus maripaludis TaxID=39152 RepID=A0A7J9S2U7_METMI|nr:hypothetical protein [Methanococcus maripaludis]MBB6067858.1 hypothetical protein [Methanococcus maripaludis]